MKEMRPYAKWSTETHMLANIYDMIGTLFSADYEPLSRPGEIAAFSTAEPIDSTSYEEKLAKFREGVSNG